MLPAAAYHLRISVVVGFGAGVVAAVVGYAAAGWAAVAGVAGGMGVMLAATLAAAVQAKAVVAGRGTRRVRLAAALAGIVSLAIALGCFWWLVNYVGVPGWSLFIGVTAIVAGLVCGFALRGSGFGG